MDLQALRHSASHILASAVQELYPGTKLAIGPSIEDGFYYDFDRQEPFTPEDLVKIEERMRQIINGQHPFVHEEWPKNKARDFFRQRGEQFKLELIDGIPGETVSIYKHHTFTDLCEGPHVKTTKDVPIVKLLAIAGAYWHGNEHQPMLQRIYGTAWPTQAALDAYLKRLEEAKARDHRKLGTELGLFSFEEIAGPGVVFYHPKGALVRMLIEDFIKQEHLKRGYQLVGTPHLFRADLWKQSGHLEYYRDYMFMLKAEQIDYGLKPMNCPGHILIYRSKTRSYRDLPIRFFELGTVYRFEKSGVLHGLLRVRGFTQDDAHIFCLPEQLVDEIGHVIAFCQAVLKTFGFTDFQVELSTKPEKAIGRAEDWERAEHALAEALRQRGIAFDVHHGDGAFYGPKIDVKIKDSLGRAWQCSTIQCDFALPERFGLTYVGADGQEHRPIMLHRALLGSVERFFGTLIEHYGGAFPLWLAPVQAVVIPITDAQRDYAQQVSDALRRADLRVELDDRSEKMQYKIREAQLQKIPYMLVVGNREQAAHSVAVRTRAGGDEGTLAVEALVARLQAESQRPS